MIGLLLSHVNFSVETTFQPSTPPWNRLVLHIQSQSTNPVTISSQGQGSISVIYSASHSNNQCIKIWQHDGESASASHGGPRQCCPEAGCSDTGAGCGVVTSGWCTDGGCAGLLINTKYTRGRTWSLPTVTTLASALAHCTGTLVHWWYKWYTVHALHLGHIVQRKQIHFVLYDLEI